MYKRRNKIEKGEYYGGSDISAMGEDETTFEILDGKDRDNIEQVESIVAQKKFPFQTLLMVTLGLCKPNK
jgi:hypothetical protein